MGFSQEAATVAHVLGRAAFGPSPEDWRRAREIGVEDWLREQLRPDRVPDDEVESALAAFSTLDQDIGTLLREYPPPGLARRLLREDEELDPRMVRRLAGRSLTPLRDLGDRMENVVVLTMSEFGRTVEQNGNAGTDHGHANACLVLGGRVAGGRVYGRWPGLEPEQRYEGRDLELTTDFRDVFAEVAHRHLRPRRPGALFPGYDLDPTRYHGLFEG